MKKNTLIAKLCIGLLCIAIVVWGLFSSSGLLVIFLLPIAYLDYVRRKKKRACGTTVQELQSIDELIARYGTPDTQIIADATHGNEAGGNILIYRQQGFCVINGIAVKKEEIIDTVLKNEGNPYTLSDYQIRVRTTLDNSPCLFIPVGNDAGVGNEVLEQLRKELETL